MSDHETPDAGEGLSEARGWVRRVLVDDRFGGEYQRLEEMVDVIAARVQTAEAERDRHGLCVCNTGPGTDGPDEFCPRHGRTYGDLLRTDDAVLARAEAAESALAQSRAAFCAVSDRLATAETALAEWTAAVEAQRRFYNGEKSAGWDPDDENTFAEEIAHLHEEVSEVFRAFRLTKGHALTFDASGKPQGTPAECADVAIGLFYIAERFGFDLMDAVEVKHRYNLTRSYAAEGRRLHARADALAPDTAGGAE